MKRLFSLLLILCLLLPAAALGEDKMPRLRFPAANYVVYMDSYYLISMDIPYSGEFRGAKTLELRDKYNQVLCSQKYQTGQQITFRVKFGEDMLGGYELSVWCEDQLVTSNTAYMAVTDRHRKAVVKPETPESWMSVIIDCDTNADQTDAILEVLAQNDVKATFFLSGTFVQSFPEAAEKIRDAGHEIGSSTLTHPHLMEKGLDARVNQVLKGSQIIRESLGVIPRLFMPPYGEFDTTVSGPARAEGMEVVLWSVDSQDGDKKYENNPAATVKRATAGVEAGSIVLFRLDGYNTPQVLAEALAYYRDTLGLTVVTVGELVESAGIELPACPYEGTRVIVTNHVI